MAAAHKTQITTRAMTTPIHVRRLELDGGGGGGGAGKGSGTTSTLRAAFDFAMAFHHPLEVLLEQAYSSIKRGEGKAGATGSGKTRRCITCVMHLDADRFADRCTIRRVF